MDFRTRRTCSIVVVCSYLFLGGVEFAVILPTAWEYLQSLGVEEESLLGVTVSGYSMSAAVAGIVGGKLADSHRNITKLICMCSTLVMVVGNILYVLGISVWNIILSRFICGVGTGAGAALLAYVCRTTTVQERTAMLSMCNASRQIGILIGPAFQLLLTCFDFQIGPLIVTRLNAAGLFMAFLWIIFIIICSTMFYDVSYEWQQLHENKGRSAQEVDEPETATPTFSISSRRTLSMCESVTVSPPETLSLERYSQEIIQDTVISLLGTVFTVFFGQILIETLLPVYMKYYFGLGDIATSLMYMIGGFECLLLLGLIIWLSRTVPDWVLNIAGLLFIVSGFTILLITLPSYERGDMSNLVPFVIANIVIGAGYPLANVANTSLISKCLSVQTQGVGHGLRSIMSYLGLVIGPLWAGATARQPVLLLGVTLALGIFHLILHLDVLPHMVRVEKNAANASLEEETPLVDHTTRRSSWSSSGGFSGDNEDSISSI